MKLVWLNGATRSLRQVYHHIKAINPEAAVRVAARIKQGVERLVDFPSSGRLGTVEGTRELVIPKLPYVVVYRVRAQTVEIMRVFHAARTSSSPRSVLYCSKTRRTTATNPV
jgi:toxin ParE1/3/4